MSLLLFINSIKKKMKKKLFFPCKNQPVKATSEYNIKREKNN